MALRTKIVQGLVGLAVVGTMVLAPTAGASAAVVKQAGPFGSFSQCNSARMSYKAGGAINVSGCYIQPATVGYYFNYTP